MRLIAPLKPGLILSAALFFLWAGSLRSETTVPNSQGTARVVIGKEGVRVELVDEKGTGGAAQSFEYGEPNWEEKQILVLWSPRGTAVCVTEEIKRGSWIHFFTVDSKQVREVEDSTQGSIHAGNPTAPGHTAGRFYYLVPLRWIGENRLEIAADKNLVSEKTDEFLWFRGLSEYRLEGNAAALIKPFIWGNPTK